MTPHSLNIDDTLWRRVQCAASAEAVTSSSVVRQALARRLRREAAALRLASPVGAARTAPRPPRRRPRATGHQHKIAFPQAMWRDASRHAHRRAETVACFILSAVEEHLAQLHLSGIVLAAAQESSRLTEFAGKPATLRA